MVHQNTPAASVPSTSSEPPDEALQLIKTIETQVKNLESKMTITMSLLQELCKAIKSLNEVPRRDYSGAGGASHCSDVPEATAAI
ncbi:hypothetical protein SCP_0100140 [Sparassis crispa]|uniref:Uncharacterized protein n=1 Tax=Sparassis crispa TaxID=139825 RepID=A0A401G4S3_9APHY|nr:hypothetical protein SCP_0100140 [Sparassis crispa]GBE77142.1 hypothetical protein SCP_0100140 [Sparassis crispa]